ncbi:MAG: ATP-binding protein [Candidatus Brocadiia bacterium]
MLAKVHSLGIFGIDAFPVEPQVSPMAGQPEATYPARFALVSVMNPCPCWTDPPPIRKGLVG